MLVIGVTGGVGTGKSTVARLFRELGAVVLDADRIAHERMGPGTPAWRRIRARWGGQVLRPGGRIDRAALAARVFRDRWELRRLCRIVHPEVRREIGRRLRKIRRHRPAATVVLDIPLLFETASRYPTDAVVVVWAPTRVAALRLAARSGWSESKVARRRAAQMALSQKLRRADFVVRNGGTLGETRRQVRRIWNNVRRRKHDG